MKDAIMPGDQLKCNKKVDAEPTRRVIFKTYKLTIETKNADPVELDINNSHHTEMILRGLVHSGYSVKIKEVTKEEYLTADETLNLRIQGAEIVHCNEPPEYYGNGIVDHIAPQAGRVR